MFIIEPFVRIITVIGLLLTSVGVHAQQYTVNDLGTIDPSYFGVYGAGISASGQVTGSFSSSSYNGAHAFLYTNGAIEDLGTLGGTNSAGASVNASGQVTGYSWDGSQHSRAFLYANGTMQDLGTLGGSASSGAGINASGQVTGWSYTGFGGMRMFLYDNGLMQDLGTLPGGTYSVGTAINDSGQVTGVSGIGNATHAVIYSNGTMQDLGTLGGNNSYAFGINASGAVTGWSETTNGIDVDAFLYDAGTMQALGSLGGTVTYGYAINDLNEVTGMSSTGADDAHAFLYSNGQMIDLNAHIGATASLYTLYYGIAINNRGQIVVVAHSNAVGQQVTLLLTPTGFPSASTPSQQ